MKCIDLKEYINHFKVLPFSLVYSFHDPDEYLYTLNELILGYIDRHAYFGHH